MSDPIEAESPLARAILERRSWRIYADEPIAEDDLEALRRLAAAAPSVRGGGAARVQWVVGEDPVAGLTRAIQGGLVGKINAWLRSAPPTAYAVLVGDRVRGVLHGDRRLYNVDVAVAGELVALGAAARGLAGCWMSGIHFDGVQRHLALGEHERTPAVIALGRPGIRRKGALVAAAWDKIARTSIRGDRRRSTAEVCHLDRFGSGAALPTPDLAQLPDDGRSLEALVAGLSPAGRFAGEAPSERDLAWIVEGMRRAPSADNFQTWRFVVIRERAAAARVLAAAGLEGEDPPGALVAFVAAPALVSKLNREQPFALIDHPIALTHGALLAEALGLAWSAAFAFDHEAVRDAVGAPRDHEVTALLLLDVGGDHAAPPFPPWCQLHREVTGV